MLIFNLVPMRGDGRGQLLDFFWNFCLPSFIAMSLHVLVNMPSNIAVAASNVV